MACSSESEDGLNNIENSNNEKNTSGVDECDRKPESQRYIKPAESENEEIEVEVSVRENFCKILSKMIENDFEFVDPKDGTKKPIKTKKQKDRVKLLKDFNVHVNLTEDDIPSLRQLKRPIIKRRIVEKEFLNEAEKLKLAAVSGDWILSKKETEAWQNRIKGEFYEYKRGSTEGSAYHYIEPTTEFTKLRKKNCWSEKKITRE